MNEEKIVRKVIEKFVELKRMSSTAEREISDRLLALLEDDASLKNKLCDARIADTDTKRNLIAEILDEVKRPILSSIFSGAGRGRFSATPAGEERGFPAGKRRGDQPYRKVLRCTLEK